MNKPTPRTLLAVAALAAVAAVAATDAAAQDAAPDAEARAAAVDPRWFPWLGCWQLREEQLDPSAPDAGAETAALLDRTVICVRPHGAGPGVTLTTAAGDRVLAERTLVADGVGRDVQATDCPGRERSAWSRDGRRLFTHAELQCDDQPARTVTGVSLLSSRSTWVDVRVVAIGGRQMVEIRRYNPLPASAQDDRPESAPGVAPADVRQARREAAAPLDLRDVMEAGSRTSPRVVEALLVETEPRLPLDGAALIALDDAGINGGVIDLLVALAYPERFVVERRDRGGAWSSGGWGGFSGFHDPIWYDRYYPYYVSPFGYYSWGRGYYPYLVGGYATPFVVLPGGDAEAGRGRVVAGRGYTRVSPRGGSGGGRRAVPRTGAAAPAGGESGGGSVSRRGGSGGSSGGAVSRGGYSTAGGGTRTGRRAVPRR